MTATRYRKFICQGCYGYVGPGYPKQEIWYRPSDKKWVCEWCADSKVSRSAGTFQIANRTELNTLTMVQLQQLCAGRIANAPENT